MIKQTPPPNPYMVFGYEHVNGHRFKEPVDIINGKTYYDFNKNSYEKKHWGSIYRESYSYNAALKHSKFDSELWENKSIRNKAFNEIYDFIKNGGSGDSSSITSLFPFEIYMLNDGFEMVSFCELNAINPGVSLVAESRNGDSVKNPKGFIYKRLYKKNNLYIYLAFGYSEMDNEGNVITKCNFYFKTSKSEWSYQVDNDINNYKKSINGQLTPLESWHNKEQ